MNVDNYGTRAKYLNKHHMLLNKFEACDKHITGILKICRVFLTDYLKL